MKGLWFESEDHVSCAQSELRRQLIHGYEAHDAVAMAQTMMLQAPPIFKMAHRQTIDAEESLDVLRLCRTVEFSAHMMLPLDPSTILQAQRIGCLSIGIQVSIPTIEVGIQRQALLKNILSQLDIDAWAFGGIQPSDITRLAALGFKGALLSSEYSSEAPERNAQLWPTSVV